MKRIFITGANGFIGKNAVFFFSSKGIEILALVPVNKRVKEFDSLDNVIQVEFDPEKPYALEEAFLKKIDIVYHFAWTGVSAEYKNDIFKQLQSLHFTIEILLLSIKHGVSKFIFTGSISEFSLNRDFSDKNALPNPSNIYGAVKYSTRLISKIISQNSNISFVSVLISSVYGPGRVDNNLISYTINKLLNNEIPIYLDLDKYWDYIFIDDLLEILFRISINGKRELYFVGSGETQNLKDVVLKIHHKINPSGKIPDFKYESKIYNTENIIVDVSILFNEFNFKPMIKMDDGLDRTINYFRGKTENGTW